MQQEERYRYYVTAYFLNLSILNIYHYHHVVVSVILEIRHPLPHQNNNNKPTFLRRPY